MYKKVHLLTEILQECFLFSFFIEVNNNNEFRCIYFVETVPLLCFETFTLSIETYLFRENFEFGIKDVIFVKVYGQLH